MNSSFPLDESHLNMVNEVLNTEPMLKPLLQKCKECGLPVDDLIDTVNWQMDHARKIKANFFPNHP